MNTPYDDVFRTLLTDCRQLMIPIVNEVFQADYIGNEQIILRENEIFLRQQNGKEDKRITDSSFAILNEMGWKNYHLECQSVPDGTMLIRMYEYDSQMALKDSTLEKNILNVNFPQSAVLYLRHTKNTPDILMISINTPGGQVSYKIPVLKVKQYDIDTIFRKRLLFLIPFYIFTYENEFAEIAGDELLLEQLKDTYTVIARRLDMLCSHGEVDEYTRQTICEMSEKVINYIAEKYENIKKEVTKIMGGQVLEYEAKRILRQGIEQGVQQGMKQGMQQGMQQGVQQGIQQGIDQAACRMLKNGATCEEVAKLLELNIEEVKRLEV